MTPDYTTGRGIGLDVPHDYGTRRSTPPAPPYSGRTDQIYRSRWAEFGRWCQVRQHEPLLATPPIVLAYITELSNEGNADGEPCSVGRLRQIVAAIDFYHRANGRQNPSVSIRLQLREVYECTVIRRRPKPPVQLLRDDIEEILTYLHHMNDLSYSPTWISRARLRRDRLIFLLGFNGACSHGELVDLRIRDVDFVPNVHMSIRLANPDSRGEARVVTLVPDTRRSMCAPCAWMDWTTVLGAAETGPYMLDQLLSYDVDRSTHICTSRWPEVEHIDPQRRVLCSISKHGFLSVTRLNDLSGILRKRAEQAGLPPNTVAVMSADSLRAGRLRQSALDRVSEYDDAAILGRWFRRPLAAEISSESRARS